MLDSLLLLVQYLNQQLLLLCQFGRNGYNALPNLRIGGRLCAQLLQDRQAGGHETLRLLPVLMRHSHLEGGCLLLQLIQQLQMGNHADVP
ncbi:hypothetical protein ACK3YH_19720 [Aeromonas caviae]